MNRAARVAALAVAALAVAGCSSTTKPAQAPPATARGQHNDAYNLGKDIVAWYDATGTADSTKLAADAAAISQDGLNGERQLMSNHCSQMYAHAANALTHPAFPDPAGQDHWLKALNLQKNGAADCIAGLFALDAAKVAAGSAQMKQGAQELNALTARVNEITAAAK